ncbi:MAG: ABC transporter permease, partial [Alphaproteobacteria bacterium]
MDAPTDVAVTEEIAAEGIPRPRAWVSPLNKRRWQTFKANRRGYWSLWIFLVLFGLSLCAEFIANDKPILVEYEGELYFPIFQAYPETDFG